MTRLVLAAGIAVAAACASGQTAASPTPVTAPCPPSDSTANRWIASVFIDGKLIAANLPAKREQEFPETFALTGPEPAALAALAPEKIDLIQFSKGPDAEAEYQLCPGGVAFLITTRN